MDKLKDICDLNEKLIDYTKSHFHKGLEQVDTKEAGEVIDMIKDLAEAEEKIVKACYYKTVIEAMEHGDAYGYNNGGRGNGRGSSSDGYRHRNSMGRFTSGYTSEPMMRDMHERFGDMRMETPVSEAQNNFDRWRNARRHYQETRSKSDKEEMDMHAKAHLNEAMITLKEVMANSDPELQRKMKNDLTNLINDIS